jgi:hypothetical protein
MRNKEQEEGKRRKEEKRGGREERGERRKTFKLGASDYSSQRIMTRSDIVRAEQLRELIASS